MITHTIRAAHNLSIELNPTVWRLVNGTPHPEQPEQLAALLEARALTITCSPTFARARRLPAEGRLVPEDIARVVVGWAPESQNWHLGLLLAAQPGTGFKMQWCGLATWPSGRPADHLADARLAGQALADMINRPFHLIPAPTEPVNSLADTQSFQPTSPLPAVQVPGRPAGRAAPLPAAGPVIEPGKPPFQFEAWSLVAVPRGYVWQRRGSWLITALGRVIGLSGLTVLFLVLGIGSQTRGLAPVTPTWLPQVGIAVGIVMGLLAARHSWTLLSAADVMVDTTRREIRRQNRFTGRLGWRVSFDAVVYVLLSQTPARAQGRSHRDAPMKIAHNAWLHLYDGSRFWLLADLGQVEGYSHTWPDLRETARQPGRRWLKLADYDTPAHHAALFLARVLGTDAWLDVR